MDIVITAVLSAVGGTLFGVLIAGGKRVFATFKAVKALSHDALFRYCRYVLQDGHITQAELENLNYLYSAYSGLGLNGAGREMYERAKALPLKD